MGVGLVVVRQPPSPRQHNLTDQSIGVPVQLNEPRGQLVQQFGMRGGLPRDAEVVWSLHQRSAHEMKPNSIGPNPSGQRVLLPGDPLGQFKSTRLIRVDFRCPGTGQHVGHTALDQLSRLIQFPPSEESTVDRDAAIRRPHGFSF